MFFCLVGYTVVGVTAFVYVCPLSASGLLPCLFPKCACSEPGIHRLEEGGFMWMPSEGHVGAHILHLDYVEYRTMLLNVLISFNTFTSELISIFCQF